MEEVWKNIEGYDTYQVSNLGRVKSLPKLRRHNSGSYYMTKEIIMKPCKGTYGYPQVVLISNEGEHKTIRVHRLVAEAFIPNPNNLPCVNHKDENPENPSADNLEWCDYKYNTNYGNCRGKMSNAKKGTKRSFEAVEKTRIANSIPILQYDMYGNFIRRWDSASQVEREIGIKKDTIYNVCRGKFRHAGFYVWKYADR